ncbi:hypothetical protein [uncultured Ferrimonas sp.]|uniref:hypothetical protein n=1 Tax=uncultured Ferrimonas sp. TaxID=432640 RepID=UPI00260B2289|nr:hypothetical protein [uncultured Ferrimonas sp.]
MFSQSLPAQLLRMCFALAVALLVVHNYQPLRDALSQNAVEAGCHQGDSSSNTMADHSGHNMSHH